jgi:hypothetical protein
MLNLLKVTTHERTMGELSEGETPKAEAFLLLRRVKGVLEFFVGVRRTVSLVLT